MSTPVAEIDIPADSAHPLQHQQQSPFYQQTHSQTQLLSQAQANTQTSTPPTAVHNNNNINNSSSSNNHANSSIRMTSTSQMAHTDSNTSNNSQQGQSQSQSQSKSGSKNRNIIASHYQIAQKIGEGSFGIIFKGYDLLRSNQPVAIKFESRKSDAPQLKDEFRAYKILNSAINNYYKNYETERTRYLNAQGIPKVFYFGQEGYYNILIIQLLGPSLEDLFEWCGRKFSISTVARLAIQMIERIQFLHENNMIYRDIKPDNFLIGATPNDNKIYLVDYGMVKQYRDPITHTHIQYRERKSLSGTARYMSINTHLGREQSRRDDLESLGNVFVYFLKGQLPWQGLKAPTNKLKYEKIGERKQKIPIDELCSGLPIQVAEYIRRVRGLKFEEEPDYLGYVRLFESILHDMKKQGVLDEKYEYDWMKLNEGNGWSWGKNKKINLNGYGSGVRHTTTQQTNVSTSQNQTQQVQQSQQQIQNAQQRRSHSHSHSHSTPLAYYGQSQEGKSHTVSGSGGVGMNERTTLLFSSNKNYNQQAGGHNNSLGGEYSDIDGSGRRNQSWLSWICCC